MGASNGTLGTGLRQFVVLFAMPELLVGTSLLQLGREVREDKVREDKEKDLDIAQLLKPGKPCFYAVVADDSQLENFRLAIDGARDGTVARVVRGKKSRTVSHFFDEISAALQFPYYFGENWAALDECLADLE